jgi:hypothetical protein
MKYELYEGDSKPADSILSVDLDDNFSAERWAKAWVRTNAKSGLYTLEGTNGGFAVALFRTNAGQWYFTPKPS